MQKISVQDVDRCHVRGVSLARGCPRMRGVRKILGWCISAGHDVEWRSDQIAACSLVNTPALDKQP
jgi:hypothetical protein